MSNKGFSVEGKRDKIDALSDARDEGVEFRNKIKCKRYVKKRWFMRNIKFTCQLYRGDHLYPKEKDMTCAELGESNRKLVQNFIKTLDNGEDKPLWTWKIKNLDTFKKIKQKLINDF